MSDIGYIDSFYHGSAVDGKGLRSVLFFSGCNLRCPFCHNPETLFSKGKAYTVEEALKIVLRYEKYIRKGGVTLSGGEPFLQAEFCIKLISCLKEHGLNVVAETNGQVLNEAMIALLDGMIVDVKNQTGEDVLSVYGTFLALTQRHKKSVRLTNVLVPEVNDSPAHLAVLKELSNRFSLPVKFLPFKKLCEEKYEKLSLSFPYACYREATVEDIKRAEAFIK